MAVQTPSQITRSAKNRTIINSPSTSLNQKSTASQSNIQSNVKQGQQQMVSNIGNQGAIRSLQSALAQDPTNRSNQLLLNKLQGGQTGPTATFGVQPGSVQTSQGTRDLGGTMTTPLQGRTPVQAVSQATQQTGTTAKAPKAFTTSDLVNQSVRSGRDLKTPDVPVSNIMEAQAESERKLTEGADRFNAILDQASSRTEGRSLESMERITQSFEQADKLYESGIDDIQQSTRSLEKLFTESRDISLEGAEFTRDKAFRTLEDAREQAREDFDSAIEEQRQSVIDQRVRDETFAGLRGQFGSSARLENIDRAEQQGRSLLTSLQKSAARSERQFGQDINDVGQQYMQNVKEINNTSDVKLQELFNNANKEIRSIQQDRAKTEMQKASEINNIVNNLNDTQNAIANSKAQSVFDLNKALAGNIIDLKKTEFAQQQTTFQDLMGVQQFKEQAYQSDLQQAQRDEQMQMQREEFALKEQQVAASLEDQKAKLELAKQQLANDKENTQFQKTLAIEKFELDKLQTQQQFYNQQQVNELNNSKLALQASQQEWTQKLQEQQMKEEKKQQELTNKFALQEMGLDEAKINIEMQKLDQAQQKIDLEVAEASKTLNKQMTGDLSDLELSASQKDNIIGAEGVLASLDEVMPILDKVSTGFISGNAQNIGQYFGFESDQNYVQVTAMLNKVKADFMKAISGAAVSEQEAQRLSKFLPDTTDRKETLVTKINTLREEMLKIRNNVIKAGGGEPLVVGQYQTNQQQSTAQSIAFEQATAQDFFQ